MVRSWHRVNIGYGYFYEFGNFYGDDLGIHVDTFGEGVIAPSMEPAVFELKNPTQNVVGRVL